MMTLTAESQLLAGLGVLLLAMILLSSWLSRRLRAMGRDVQKALASARQAAAIPVPTPGASVRQAGPFWEKQQEVYASLYSRFRRAADSGIPRAGRTPDFGRFSRDELLRYLSRRKVRERDAADAIAALDRGDTFAMSRLMTKLHEKVDQRDASLALQRAMRFAELNELYLSDPVRDAVTALSQRLTPGEDASQAIGGERRQVSGATRASEKEIRDALGALQRAMRNELGGERPAAAISPGTPRLSSPAEQPVSQRVHVENAKQQDAQAM
jgi:hypothetical protein